MQWLRLHAAYPTGGYLARCKLTATDECLFCHDMKDLIHIVIDCERLHAVVITSNEITSKLIGDQKVPLWLYMLGPPVTKVLYTAY